MIKFLWMHLPSFRYASFGICLLFKFCCIPYMILAMPMCSLIRVEELASVDASQATRGEQARGVAVDSSIASTTKSQMICTVCYLNFAVVGFTVS